MGSCTSPTSMILACVFGHESVADLLWASKTGKGTKGGRIPLRTKLKSINPNPFWHSLCNNPFKQKRTYNNLGRRHKRNDKHGSTTGVGRELSTANGGIRRLWLRGQRSAALSRALGTVVSTGTLHWVLVVCVLTSVDTNSEPASGQLGHRRRFPTCHGCSGGRAAGGCNGHAAGRQQVCSREW